MALVPLTPMPLCPIKPTPTVKQSKQLPYRTTGTAERDTAVSFEVCHTVPRIYMVRHQEPRQYGAGAKKIVTQEVAMLWALRQLSWHWHHHCCIRA